MPLRCGRQNGSGEVGLCPRLRLRRRPHKRRKAHVAIHKPLVAALTHSDGRKNAHHKDRHRRQMARPALVHMNVWVVGGWSGRRADDVLGWLTCVATGWNLSDAANIAEECHGSRREKSDQREGDNGAAEPPLHTQTRRDVPVQGIAVAGTRLGSHFARGRRWALGGQSVFLRGAVRRESARSRRSAAATAASASTGSSLGAAVERPVQCGRVRPTTASSMKSSWRR